MFSLGVWERGLSASPMNLVADRNAQKIIKVGTSMSTKFLSYPCFWGLGGNFVSISGLLEMPNDTINSKPWYQLW